jgi:GNAT superfamily N-acetyltransferase
METEKKFDIIPAESLPLDKILQVLTLALGQGNEAYKKSEALWRWKHLESPSGPSYAIAAVDPSNHQIASVRLLMYWGFENVNGDRIICSRAVDVSTHPDYRRIGIFSTLTRKAIEDLTKKGISVIYATPKLKGKSIGGYLKLGFEMIDPWPVYVKILRPLSFLKGITIGRNKSKIQFVPNWKDVFNDRVLTFLQFSSIYTEQDIISFLEKTDQNRKSASGWRIKKDFNYIKWRYGDHPNVDYGFIPLVEGGKISGLGILRRNIRYNMVEIVVSELLFIDSNALTGRKLLREIKGSVNAVYLIAHFNLHTRELSAIKRNGFMKAPGQEIVFLIKGLAAENDNFNKQHNWNFSLGDIELF